MRTSPKTQQPHSTCGDLPTAFHALLGTSLFLFGNLIAQSPSLALEGEPTNPMPYWLAALDVFETGDNLPSRTSGRHTDLPEDWRMAIVWGRTLVCVADELLNKERRVKEEKEATARAMKAAMDAAAAAGRPFPQHHQHHHALLHPGAPGPGGFGAPAGMYQSTSFGFSGLGSGSTSPFSTSPISLSGPSAFGMPSDIGSYYGGSHLAHSAPYSSTAPYNHTHYHHHYNAHSLSTLPRSQFAADEPVWPPESPFSAISMRRPPITSRMGLALMTPHEIMMLAMDQFTRGMFRMPHPRQDPTPPAPLFAAGVVGTSGSPVVGTPGKGSPVLLGPLLAGTSAIGASTPLGGVAGSLLSDKKMLLGSGAGGGATFSLNARSAVAGTGASSSGTAAAAEGGSGGGGGLLSAKPLLTSAYTASAASLTPIAHPAAAAAVTPGAAPLPPAFSRAKELATIASEVLLISEKLAQPLDRKFWALFADSIFTQMKLETTGGLLTSSPPDGHHPYHHHPHDPPHHHTSSPGEAEEMWMWKRRIGFERGRCWLIVGEAILEEAGVEDLLEKLDDDDDRNDEIGDDDDSDDSDGYLNIGEKKKKKKGTVAKRLEALLAQEEVNEARDALRMAAGFFEKVAMRGAGWSSESNTAAPTTTTAASYNHEPTTTTATTSSFSSVHPGSLQPTPTSTEAAEVFPDLHALWAEALVSLGNLVSDKEEQSRLYKKAQEIKPDLEDLMDEDEDADFGFSAVTEKSGFEGNGKRRREREEESELMDED